MAAIIRTIGFASIVVFSAANAPLTVLMTPAIFGTMVMIVPTAEMTFPTMIRREYPKVCVNLQTDVR